MPHGTNRGMSNLIFDFSVQHLIYSLILSVILTSGKLIYGPRFTELPASQLRQISEPFKIPSDLSLNTEINFLVIVLVLLIRGSTIHGELSAVISRELPVAGLIDRGSMFPRALGNSEVDTEYTEPSEN